MKLKYFAFLFISFILAACQPILFKIYGIKQPEVENAQSIIKKAEKFGLDTHNIVSVNSKDFLWVLKYQGIPDAGVYNSEGKYIEYRQTDTSCNAGLYQFIPDLRIENTYHYPDSADLNTELNKFRNLYGQKISINEKADFYILIYWTVWAGKLNKDHVKIWEDLAKQNTHCKIKVIKVNLDLQEYWDEADRNKIIKAISKKKKN